MRNFAIKNKQSILMEEQENLTEQQPEENKPAVRPLQLTVICILTFVGSGMMLISNLVYSISYDLIKTMVENNEIPKTFANIKESLEITLSAGRPFFIIGFLLNIASLTGAIFMWNLFKKGFHIYTIAQILMLISVTYFMKSQGFPTSELLLSGVFVMFYAMNLKAMK